MTSVKLLNAPAFVAHLDAEIEVPELGKVTIDIAYGGMWYTIVHAPSIDLDLVPSNGKQISRLGEMIKVSSREQVLSTTKTTIPIIVNCALLTHNILAGPDARPTPRD